MPRPNLVEGLDYYLDRGRFVFTEDYLRRRGFCCQNGCRHCPYAVDEPSPANPLPLPAREEPSS